MEDFRLITIYALTEPDDPHAVRYIGKSYDYIRRFKEHINRAKSNKSKTDHVKNWVKSLLNKGQEPGVKVLCVCNEDEWIEKETSYIALYNLTGYDLTNQMKGGQGSNAGVVFSQERRDQMRQVRLGTKASPETREKLRLSHLGQKSARKGVKLSEETKQKIIIGLTGKKQSPETIEKRRQKALNRSPESRIKTSMAMMGHITTQETRDKISKANKGNKSRLGHRHTEESKTKMSVSKTGKKLSVEALARRLANPILHTEANIIKMKTEQRRIYITKQNSLSTITNGIFPSFLIWDGIRQIIKDKENKKTLNKSIIMKKRYVKIYNLKSQENQTMITYEQLADLLNKDQPLLSSVTTDQLKDHCKPYMEEINNKLLAIGV